MLVNYSLNNYKSFKDNSTISFNCTSLSGNEDTNIITEGNYQLLKSLAIYGPNASGKSNLVGSLVFMRWFVLNSSKNMHAEDEIDVEPFRLSTETENQPSRFEIEILVEAKKYRYGFEVTKDRVISEWLFESTVKKEYPCFIRIEQDFKIYDRFKEGRSLEEKTRKNALFVSVSSQFNGLKSTKIINWFFNLTPIHGLGTDSLGYSSSTIDFLMNTEHSEAIKSLIRNADLGIQDLSFKQIEFDETRHELAEVRINGLKQSYNDQIVGSVVTYHKKYNEDLLPVTDIAFELDKEESAGTRKYFNIIGLVYEAAIEGKIIVLDELDARLHTLLSYSIIKMFNSKFNSKGQFIFSTHDTNLINQKLFRRDQIYFTDKNEFGCSTTKSFSDFKPRKEAALEKKYLDGDFGGIPIISNLLEEIVTANG